MLAHPRRAFAFVSLLLIGSSSSCECVPDRPKGTTSGEEGGGGEAGGGEAGGGQIARESKPCPSEAVRNAPPSSCPDERQIVPRQGDTCTDLHEQGWVVTELASYCIYAHIDQASAKLLPGVRSNEEFAALQALPLGGQDEQLSALLGNPPGLSSDCTMLPAGNPGSREAMAKRFTRSLEQPTQQAGAPVRVAVIDTAPRDRKQAKALHGKLMAGIVERLAPAPVEVVTYPGLPRDREGKPDLVRGGYYGHQSDLAFAIAEALQDWQALDPRPPLILNLSVGWDPSVPDANTGLVAAMLAIARCEGALVFASAGNRHPRACTQGPTGPALYASFAAPTGDACRAAPLPAPPAIAGSFTAPLVYAVSPVDARGKPLDLSRANAPLAALGVDAVVAGELGPMSGSSVATAVVSGIAARRWSLEPDLGADALALALYGEGTGHAQPADATLMPGSEWAEQHVIGLIHNEDATDASEIPPGATEQPFEGKLHEQTCRACELDESVHWPSTLTDLYDATTSAWVVPQPDDVMCPTCKIDKNKLSLQISSAYPTNPVDVRVTFWSSRTTTETVHFGGMTVPVEGNTGAPLVLSNAQLCTVDGDGSSPTAGYVEFVFYDATKNVYYAVGNSIAVRSSTPCP